MAAASSFETIEPSREAIDNLPGATVLEFGTPWCGYCQAAAPLLAAALQDKPAVRHIKVEDGSGRRLGRSFQIKLWPTFIFLHDGKEAVRLTRPTQAQSIAAALSSITGR
ncbi:MAG TPA: thioredoxin family protein [Spongiibacteraceae bacterium]|nr:thioredoxin family protein [Spongiibacteraceae bacterium]